MTKVSEEMPEDLLLQNSTLNRQQRWLALRNNNRCSEWVNMCLNFQACQDWVLLVELKMMNSLNNLAVLRQVEVKRILEESLLVTCYLKLKMERTSACNYRLRRTTIKSLTLNLTLLKQGNNLFLLQSTEMTVNT
jgi:hypothetical protein